MEHLSPEQLVDALDGVEPPHLATCASCRDQLEDLRASSAAASSVAVPEPSPLFWREFSDRVHEATVEQTGGPGGRARRWLFGGAWWGLPLAAGAAAAVMLAVAVGVREMRPSVVAPAPVASAGDRTPPVTADGASVPAAVDDSSLTFVADLASGLDWDGFSQAGLTPPLGGVDDALGQLTDGERAELRQLLAQELGRPGA